MKTIFYFLLFFLFSGFLLGQFGRISMGQGIFVSILDIAVFFFAVFNVFYTSFLTKIKNNKFFKPWLIFIVICLLSLLVNTYVLNSNQILIAFMYLLRWIFYSLVFFSVSMLKKDVKDSIIRWLIITGFIVVCFGYIQYFWYQNLRNLFYLGWDEHMYRMFSTFLDPNFAGSFFVLYFIFIFRFAIKSMSENNKFKKLSFCLLCVIVIIAIFLTFSRSALLMLLACFFTFTFILKKKKLVMYLLFFLLFLIILASPKFYLENVNLFRVVSTEARIISAHEAIQISAKNPVFGVGFNAYRYALLRFGFRDEEKTLQSHADAGTDNSFLFVLATTGIIGFLSYLYLLFSLLKISFSNKTFLMSVIVSSIAGVIINALFINSLFFPPIMLWMWMLMGVYGE